MKFINSIILCIIGYFTLIFVLLNLKDIITIFNPNIFDVCTQFSFLSLVAWIGGFCLYRGEKYFPVQGEKLHFCLVLLFIGTGIICIVYNFFIGIVLVDIPYISSFDLFITSLSFFQMIIIALVFFMLGIIRYKKFRGAVGHEILQKPLKQTIKIENPEYRLKYNEGVNLYKQKQYYQSIEIFRDILTMVPDEAKVWNALGIVYYSMKDYDQAVNMFEYATYYSPERDEYQKNLDKAKEKFRAEITTKGIR